jgi:hypothetical protein
MTCHACAMACISHPLFRTSPNCFAASQPAPPFPCLPAALQRKGKADDVTEDDMESVVHAHNSMNEITWRHVLQWESLHREVRAGGGGGGCVGL